MEIDNTVNASQLPAALDAIRSELRALGSTPVSDNELAWAKLRVARAHTTKYITNRAIVDAVVRANNLGYELESVDSAASQLASASVAGVQDDIHTCIAAGLTLSLVGDEQRFAQHSTKQDFERHAHQPVAPRPRRPLLQGPRGAGMGAISPHAAPMPARVRWGARCGSSFRRPRAVQQ